VRSTTFLFTTLCTYIQIFGVLSVQHGCNDTISGWPTPRLPRRPRPTRAFPRPLLPEARGTPSVVYAHATWSPLPCRHSRTALSTGPPRVPLRSRPSRPLVVLGVKAGVSRRGEGTFSLPTCKTSRGRPSPHTPRARRPCCVEPHRLVNMLPASASPPLP
jgi:hypothetical protein